MTEDRTPEKPESNTGSGEGVPGPVRSLRLRRRRPRRWPFVLVGLIGLILGSMLGTYAFMSETVGVHGWRKWTGFLQPAFGGQKQVNILLLGVDRIGAGLADTLILVHVDLEHGYVGAISIPRDSRVFIPGFGVNRINASHPLGGVELTIRTVENLLGVKVDRYALVGVKGLVQIVNAVGGVDLGVEKRMVYHDHFQGLAINLRPGFQHLNGWQAVGYVRFRHDAVGDVGRMQRQQKFLRVFARQLLRPANAARLPQLMSGFLNTVRTDLHLHDLMALKNLGDHLDIGNLPMTTLPGAPVELRGESLIQLDPVGVSAALDDIVFRRNPVVVVLNGTRNDGLAARFAAQLLQYGVIAGSLGTMPQPAKVSSVTYNPGREAHARIIHRLLACGELVSAPAARGRADITVVLGDDYSAQVN